jgi:hypothetical protein
MTPHVSGSSSDHSPYTGCSLPEGLQSLKRKLENYNAIHFRLYGIPFSLWSIRMCNYVTLICTGLFAVRYSLVGRTFYLLLFLIVFICWVCVLSIFVLFVTKENGLSLILYVVSTVVLSRIWLNDVSLYSSRILVLWNLAVAYMVIGTRSYALGFVIICLMYVCIGGGP